MSQPEPPDTWDQSSLRDPDCISPPSARTASPSFLQPHPLAGQVLEQTHACEDVRGHADVRVHPQLLVGASQVYPEGDGSYTALSPTCPPQQNLPFSQHQLDAPADRGRGWFGSSPPPASLPRREHL